MQNWVIFVSGFIYTIALLVFIYYSMSKRRKLLFRMPKDQVIEGEKNLDFEWRLIEKGKVVEDHGKYYEANSVLIPHNGIWNVAFVFLIKSGEGLRYIDVFINDQLFNAYQTPPLGHWVSFSGGFGLDLTAGDKVRFAARSPNGKFEVSAFGSYVTFTE